MQEHDLDRPEVVAVAKQEPMQLDDRGLYKIGDQAQELRIAKMMLETGAVPATFKTPAQVCMAIQTLHSLGLNWRSAIRQVGFDKFGKFIMYGDLELAIARQSGQLESIEEFLFVIGKDGKYERRCFDNGNVHLPAEGAVCRVKRKGANVHESTYSVNDAKTAGLWGKTGPWQSYPGRMLTMRARSMAIRNVFSDFTQGAPTEYDVDYVDDSAGVKVLSSTERARKKLSARLNGQ